MIKVTIKYTMFRYFKVECEHHEYFKHKGIKYLMYVLRNRKIISKIERVDDINE